MSQGIFWYYYWSQPNDSIIKTPYSTPYLARVSNYIVWELPQHNLVNLTCQKIQMTSKKRVLAYKIKIASFF
jgi:hypothetical protein